MPVAVIRALVKPADGTFHFNQIRLPITREIEQLSATR
jgi:hypothetical protein